MRDYRLATIDKNSNVEILGMNFDPSKEELRVVKRIKQLTSKQRYIMSLNDELKQYSRSLGGYINMYYVRNELLFNEINIDRANISRLIYLSTYIDYNYNQENLLSKRGLFNKNVAMSIKDIKYVLRLKDTAFYGFMREVKSLGLLYEVDGSFYLNPNYFNRGKVNFKEKEYTRIFIYTARYLYENCNSKNHKQLSYIFQLTPYMNYETNIICENPGETDFCKLKKLNLTEICEILGISTNNRQNMNKLKLELLKFYVNIDGNKYYFLSYVSVQNGYGLKDYFVINPTVAWGGRDLSVAKDLIKLCFFQQ